MLLLALKMFFWGLGFASPSEFIFPFPVHSPLKRLVSVNLTQYVFLTNPLQVPADVTISTPLMTSEPAQQVTLGAGESQTLTVTPDVMADADVKDSGVLVTSDQTIVVQAVTHYRGSGKVSIYSAGAFFVLPVSALSSEYLVLTHCIRNTCFLTIAATAPGVSTSVTLQMQITGGGDVSYKGQRYSNGDIIHESLHQHQVMQVTCEDCDMSGTVITADHPLAVLVGGDLSKVPGSSRVDFIVEQLPPLTAAGTEYILVKLRNSGGKYDDYVKVMSMEAGTTISFQGKTVTTTANKEISTFTLTSETPALLTADDAVLVLQASHGQVDRWSSLGDPALVFPPPTDQWSQAYYFAVPDLADYTGADLIVVAQTWQDGCLTINNDQIVDTSRLTGSGAGQPAVLRVQVPSGQEGHVSSSCGAISGYIYGLANYQAWSMSIGWVKILPDSTTTTTIATSATTTANTTTTATTTSTTATTTTTTANTTTATTATTTTTTATTTTDPETTQTIQTTETPQSMTTLQNFVEELTSSRNTAVLEEFLSLCPCLSNDTATAKPLNSSSLAQRVRKMKEDLLVDRKSMSKFRRAQASEGNPEVVLFVLLGIGVLTLVNVAWIVHNRWRYGLKRLSSKSQTEKSPQQPPPPPPQD